MNVSEFTRLVKEMREAQKAWFKNRLRGDLIRSKDLERRVDKALADGIVFDLDIVSSVEPGQLDLFDGARRNDGEGESA